jgi:DNA topoisomerase-3
MSGAGKMPKLIIAEKPSMATDIAKALGGFSRLNGYYKSDEYLLTWAIGHLVQLAEPHHYHAVWRSWNAKSLPIIPEEFKLTASEKTVAQLNTIKRLLNDPKVFEIINACDAGREGELIFRYILEYTACTKPIKRLWISSLTTIAIRKGFQELEEGMSNDPRYERLFEAARMRSQADWLVGINATRAVTTKLRSQKGKGVFSLGRVQTPTLSLLVDRENEIANFIPQPYWLVAGKFDHQSLSFWGQWFNAESERLFDYKEVERLLAKFNAQDLPQEAIIEKASHKERNEAPPLLYDLTSLQREANRRWGFSANRTLQIAQALYERHKLISYPRTDSRYLTADLIPSLPRRVQAIASARPYQEQIRYLSELPKLPISGRLVNPARVKDHHALIPTETNVDLAKLSGDERSLLLLIHQSFIAVFLPDAVWLDSEIVVLCSKETFRCKESYLLALGWRVLFQKKETDKTNQPQEISADGLGLPKLNPGTKVELSELKVEGEITKAPPRYSEATLLTAMERAGRVLEELELREAMAESGLGTAATRAATIERLKEVGYLFERGRFLMPSAKGIALISELPFLELRSAELTAKWEKKLSAIEEGNYSWQQFQQELLCMIADMTTSCLKIQALNLDQAKSVNEAATSKLASEPEVSSVQETEPKTNFGTCPLCGAVVLQNRKAYYCTNWQKPIECPLTIWRVISGKTLTAKQVNLLLSKGTTGLLKGFRSKQGKRFAAEVVLKNGKTDLVYSTPSS